MKILRRLVAAGIGLVSLMIVVFALQGCSSPTEGGGDVSAASPRALSDEEAYRLSSIRFRNFDAGTRQVTGTLRNQTGSYELAGWLDFAGSAGLAEIRPDTTAGKPPFLVSWTRQTVAFRELPAGQDGSGLPDPGQDVSGWDKATLDPETSPLAKGLAALLLLTADRPENPLLVKQGTAQWVGQEQLNGVLTDVFLGPPPRTVPETSAPASSAAPGPSGSAPSGSADDRTKYWVDSAGTLQQFGIRLDAIQELSVFTFTDPADLPALPTPVVEAVP
ncbi:hypothetical protein ODZ83_04790 [Acaricomes phytoseiuli]|uniref:hypothetical protein n=1 Tax=Acaricomes phytoseiuli TaxID=291968 RepID=UPI00039F1F1F|nr:hypothetical protein [Acaricomes phytoseiuli]MCW1249507.1 hypothetical protein [Acaricomes phytoseiuli]